jgi:membrane associated rhomboid family serine protease
MRSVVMPLLGINVFMFLLQAVLGTAFTESLMLISSDVFTRPWILVTSMFLHANVSHLFLNMYVLFLFGPLLEQRMGPKRFLVLYLVSGVAASFFASFFYARALGASGAIMGMIGALIILMPNLQLLLFFFIPMPLWMAGVVFAAMDVFGIFFPSGVGNIAHLVGMAVGLWYGVWLRRQKGQYHRRFSKKKSLTIHDVDDYIKSGRI